MADFAQITDVTEASFDPIPESRYPWIENRITAAETLLKSKVAKLANPAILTELESANAKSAVINAVLRLYENPKGLKSEQVDEQSYVRFGGDSGRTGLYFTEEELAWFRPTKKRVVGIIDVAPFRLGQV